MKRKIIIIISIFLMGVVLPVAGMTITPTRNLIMSLAPEEAVLELANKINQNKEDNEKKIQEMQILIDQQEATIDEQSQKLSEIEQVSEKDITSEEDIKSIASDIAYCQANLEKYSQEKYKRLKDGPEREEEGCERIIEMKKEMYENAGKEYDADEDTCDEPREEAEEKFEEYKLEYDAYHQRCD